MTVTTELKEIKETLRRAIRDMARIKESQRQTKAEMHEARDDLRRFRDLWKREKAEIEDRLSRLEEDSAKRQLTQRLERMEEVVEQPKRGNSLQERIESIVERGRRHGSTVSIEYKKLRCGDDEKIQRQLKDDAGQQQQQQSRFKRHFFASRKTDL